MNLKQLKNLTLFLLGLWVCVACKSKEYVLHPVHKSNYPAQLIHCGIDTISNVAMKAQYLGNTEKDLVFWIQVENLSDEDIELDPATFYYLIQQPVDTISDANSIHYSNVSSANSVGIENQTEIINSITSIATQNLFPSISSVFASYSDFTINDDNDSYRTISKNYLKNSQSLNLEKQLTTLLKQPEYRFSHTTISSSKIHQGYVTFPLPNYYGNLTLCIQLNEESTELDFELD